jgi:hypothetical protein
VLGFIATHVIDDYARSEVVRWQLLQVPGQVLLDLAFGLRQKGKVPSIAQRSGTNAHGECASVPNWVQQARPAIQLTDPVQAPRQMILLLLCSLLKRRTCVLIACRQRLSLVERLRAYLAYMVHAHEAGSMPALLVSELGFGYKLRRGRTARSVHTAYRSQRAIELNYKTIEHRNKISRTCGFTRQHRGCSLRAPILVPFARAIASGYRCSILTRRCRFGGRMA